MEERKDRRKTGLLLSILGVISLVLITAGVTYAFFSYAKEGQTENKITTGTIRFAYDETDPNGDGILLENALPMTDAQGMALDETDREQNAFKFAVTSVTPSTAKIPYVVTVKKTDTSTLADDHIKLYLVATGSETGNGSTLDNSTVRTFSQLPSLATNDITAAIANDNEKILFVGEVPANSKDANEYTTDFVLRMWLSGESGTGSSAVDYSPFEFMRTAVVVDNNPINAEAKITSGDFITSTAYYALPATAGCSDGVSQDQAACGLVEGATWSEHGRNEYERIAYVYSDHTVLTRSQAVNLNMATVDSFGNYTFDPTTNQTEQYYQLDGQSYTVKVNVYAEGAKVASGN